MRYTISLLAISLIAFKGHLGGALLLTVSGNPAPMVINGAAAGSAPKDATDTSTTYTLKTSASVTKLTGRINTSLPPGVTLKLNAAGPNTVRPSGNISLTTTNKNLITRIPAFTSIQSYLLTYTLSADVTAPTTAKGTVTVTLTLE